jgi:uncharacterized protein
MSKAVCGKFCMPDTDTNTEGTPTTSHAPGPEFAAANQTSYLNSLFFGPDGLRPGWGLAFYVITFYLLEMITTDLVWSRSFGFYGLWSQMLEEFGRFVAAVVPAVVLARVERRRWKVYGLPLQNVLGARFWTGAVWGFAGISVLMLALYGLHAFAFGHLVLHGLQLAKFAVFWAAMFLLVGLAEEFLLRGYSLFTLARGIGFWPAAIALSGTFALMHLGNVGEGWPGLLAAAFIGLFFCFTLRRTGSLWFAVGFHAAWDWGETFFYSVPDSGLVEPGHLLSSSLRGSPWLSGGSVGPEGSVLCFVVVAAIWIVFDRVYPATRVVRDESEARSRPATSQSMARN